MCVSCWNSENPERQTDGSALSGQPEACAWCGKLTIDGIYMRSDRPAKSLARAWRQWGMDICNRWTGEGDVDTFTISREESCLLAFALSGFTVVVLKMEGQ